MEFNEIINIIFKTATIVLALIYLLFSIVVAKQISVMTKTLEDKLNVVVSIIGSIQIALASILLIFAIFFS